MPPFGPLPPSRMYCDTIPHSRSYSEADPSCGTTNLRSDALSSIQDPHPLDAWVSWEGVTPLMLGRKIPLSQKALEGAGVFEATFTTYAPYSDMHVDHGSPPTADEYLYQYAGRLALPYPSGQIVNPRVDNTPVGVGGMDRQPVSEMPYKDLPRLELLMPSNAFLDPDAWSGPHHTPSTIDHFGRRSSSDLLFAPFRNLVKGTSEDGEATLRPGTAHASLTIACGTHTATTASLPLSVPISWHEIPQQQYAPRTGYRSFLRLQRVAFSVNGVPGINIKRALDRVFVGLEDRDDPVLEDANGPVSCRLLFPGYPINTRCNQIAVRNWKKPPAPIIRSKLAYETAKQINHYLNTLATITMDPSADRRWKIGQGYMKLEKMYLVGVSWVSKGSIQPEIWVDTDGP